MSEQEVKKWIVFDVDDVVVNYRESLHQSFKKLGKDIHWSNWNTYKHVKIYNLKDYDEFLNHMIFHKVIENAILEQGVLDLMIKLKNDGYTIGLLTARSWHPSALNVTKDLIEKHSLPVEKVVISNFKGKKTDYLNEFPGEIVGFLDDSISHVEDFISAGIKNSYLMDRPWNKKNIVLPRIETYNDFYNCFNKKFLKLQSI